jgi:4-hydroxybutyryl-CoA dehydratase/vinylacetyl-CoA-Delta-isomerase
MGIRTGEEYIDSIRRQKPNIYMDGERIDNIVDHPAFKSGIDSVATTFHMCQDNSYRDIARVESSIAGEEISRWTHLMQNEQDAFIKIELMKGLGDNPCPCSYRCITADVLHAAWAASSDIDKATGSNYHQNVVEMVKQVQKNDLVIGGGFISPKGDRSKGATEQADPDMFLHVVEKREDGIVVRGAKAHSTAAPYTNMLCVIEIEFSEDYFLGFFTPVDTKGITFICKRGQAPFVLKELDNPISSKFGGHVESMIVFDDVFIPWERVFMCGEHGPGIVFGVLLGSSHAWHKCMCRRNNMELSLGATALVADYNGVAGAAHIYDHMCDMSMAVQIMDSLIKSAVIDGWKHQSGVFSPKLSTVATGKVYSSMRIKEDRFIMQDTAGGLVATMASEKDYRSPHVSKYLEKYYKGREGVPTENRVRAMKLIEDMTASEFAGWYHAMCISGGGAVQTFRSVAATGCDFEKCKAKAKRATGIQD